MSYFDHKLFDILAAHLPEPHASTLSVFRSNDDVLGLVSQTVDRSGPVTFDEVFSKEFFRKVEDAPLGIDTSKVAIDKFLAVERENVLTNENIRNLSTFIKNAPFSELGIFIRRVQKQIALILRTVDFEAIEPRITFGATVDLKRGNSIFGRFNNPTVTATCLEYLRINGYVRYDYSGETSENQPGYSPFGANYDNFKIVTGSKGRTVSKDAKIDRFITQGEVVNLAYQSGVGDRIHEALVNFGLDKRLSAERHKELVRQASIDGLLATRDLVAASDRIVVELCRLLCPPSLFEVLMAFRSQYIEINGNQHKLEMIAPAGNGFTFELETLIFYSIALVASTENKIDVYTSAPPFVSVYGDDVILPSVYAERLDKIFTLVGFEVNMKKSFSTGKFRESCGGDYYDGNDVRGYNAKGLPTTEREWISIINAVRRVCYYNNFNSWRDSWCSNLWEGLVRALPETNRLYGPRHYGDSCINTEDQSLYTIKSKRWHGEFIKIYATRGEEYTSVGTEIRDNRIRPADAVRLVTHVSLQGHGLRKVDEDTSEYPYSLLTSTKGAHSVKRWIPFTLYGQAPSDIDELFAEVIPVNASYLLDSRQVIARNMCRQIDSRNLLREKRKEMVTFMSLFANQRVERERKVRSVFQEFTL